MDNSKGIGSTHPIAHPTKSKDRRSTGKAGQRTIRTAQQQNSTPSSQSANHSHKATPIKKRDAFNFDKQYRALAETLEITEAEVIFKGMEQRRLPEKQLAKARHVMVVKSSILVAGKYLNRLEARKLRRTQIRRACSEENLQKELVRLKTIAGRLARFISAESVHRQLESILGPQPRVKFDSEPIGERIYEKNDYTPESATEAVKTEAGLRDFIALNRRLPLFIMVINTRLEEGIPLEDKTNQRLLEHHQHEAGVKLAKKVYEKNHYSLGADTTREVCLALLEMTDEGIFSQLEEHAMPLVEKAIEHNPSAEEMPTYISMDSFRHKLASYFGMEEY